MTEEHSTPEADGTTPISPHAEKPAHQPRPRGAGLALLLALVALIGVGGVGFYAWQGHQTLVIRLADLERGMHEQLARHATLDALTELRRDMDSLRQSLDAQQQAITQDTTSRLDALRAELATQERVLDTLRALTGRDDRLWRLGEIERLLTAAQIRLRLLDDAATARLLLQEADRTAAPLGGEALPLREALQQAVVGTNVTPLDREGIAQRLTQVAEILPELPRAKPADEAMDPSLAAGWWAQTKAWVGSWLHIERKTAPAPDRNLTLAEASTRLLQARRALLAREMDQALALVRQTVETVHTHLQTDDARVRATLDELGAIAAELARPTFTTVDLTPAFTALRALRTDSAGMVPAFDASQGD
ncbi:MAG: uroporphyrinogen-III C-methyltransferase [Halothiobacillaceae bacterium]